jgi:hypothetical protein
MGGYEDFRSGRGEWKLRSKREKASNTLEFMDVLRYDELPMAFREQVLHIWGTAIGRYVVPTGRDTGVRPVNCIFKVA